MPDSAPILPAGPHSVGGYHSFELIWRGGETPGGNAILESFGIRFVSHTSPPHLHQHVIRFDAFLATSVSTRPSVVAWIRERPEARRRYAYLFVGQGKMRMTTDGIDLPANPGDVLVTRPGAGEILITAETDAEYVLFTFDTNEVRPWSLDGAPLRKVESGGPVFHMAYPFLTATAKAQPTSDARDAEVLRRLTRDVAIALLRASSPSTGRHALVEKASELIESQFSSPTLSPSVLAQQLGIARRTLERAYADDGLSVSDELRAHRALRSRRLLHQDPQLAPSEVAVQCGFSSLTAMRQALSRYYELTPAEIRRITVDRDAIVIRLPPTGP